MSVNKFLIVTTVALAPAMAQAQDWTGAYGGLTVGGSDITATVKAADAELEGDGSSVGFFAGYNYQMGNIVYGGEFDLDGTDYEIADGAVKVESTARLKARIGAPIGNGLAYGVVGAVGATSNDVKDGRGVLVGAGYDMKLAENLLIGSEVLFHNFDDDDLEVDVTTLRLRVGFSF